VAKAAVGAVGKVGSWAIDAARGGGEGAEAVARDASVLASAEGGANAAADASVDSSHSWNLAQTCVVGGFPNSFQYDTPVEVNSQGDTKAIGTLHIGDQVLADGEQSGTTGIYTITNVLVHIDPKLVDLTIDGEQIETTPEHPFYTKEYGWIGAAKLYQSLHIRKADGSYGVVEGIEIVDRQQVMYNLTVEGVHTFFVGDKHFLAHNTSNDICDDDGFTLIGYHATLERHLDSLEKGIKLIPSKYEQLASGFYTTPQYDAVLFHAKDLAENYEDDQVVIAEL
jgi:hypothetical protein